MSEAKLALSDRLLDILQANEVAKLKKLGELHQMIDAEPTADEAKTACAPNASEHAPAHPRVLEEPEFEGFAEEEVAESAWGVDTNVDAPG